MVKHKGHIGLSYEQAQSGRQFQILTLLCEGMAIRAIRRVTAVSKNTVAKLLVDVGLARATYHDQHVWGLTSKRYPARQLAHRLS